MKFSKIKLLTVTACLIGCLIACGAAEKESVVPGSGASTGQVAPSFNLKNLEGQAVALADYKGKVVVLDFWATWCGPCKRIIPDLNKLYQAYQDRGLVVVGISVDRKPESVLPKFIKQFKISYPILIADQTVTQAYGGIKYIPTLFIIDKQGKVFDKHVGGTDYAQLEKKITALL